MAVDDSVDRVLPGLQLIVGAMIMGVVAFTVVAVAIGPLGADPTLTNTLVIVLVVLGLGEAIAFMVFRSVVLSGLRRRFETEPPGDDPTARVFGAARTLWLIGAAMAEGIGLFGAVILLLTGDKLLLIAPLISVALMLMALPSRAKLDALTTRLTGANPFAR